MVMRVTNQIMQSNALQNIFNISEDLFQANQRVATGKRINKPSDDPMGIQETLALRTSISQIQQYERNIDSNRLYFGTADSSLDAIGLGITRALELAQTGATGTVGAETRANLALEVQAILDQTIQEANTQVKGYYLFGGTELLNPPYAANAGGLGAVYSGNADRLEVEVAPGITAPVTRPGFEVFGTDMNPALTGTTLIADLNGGAGITPGSFNITDRAGNVGVVNIVAGMTVNNVIAAINGAGTNITAAINADQTGLLLTDASAVILNSMSVTEAGGTTAQSLGILSTSDSSIIGSDLNPVITATTLIADLNGGAGLTLGQIDITNGTLTATVDLSGAATVGDVLTALNGAGVNVTASINSQGNAIQVVSNDPATTAVISDVAGGNTATLLGIGGGNIFVALDALREAMDRNDVAGILASFANLNASQDTVLSARAEYGALVRTMDNLEIGHGADEVSQTAQMSAVEDSDFVKDASDVAALQLALEATLNTTARVLQPSLLDFLR